MSELLLVGNSMSIIAFFGVAEMAQRLRDSV